MKKILFLFSILFLFASLSASAEILLIINKSNTISKIKRTELIDLYMGRHVRFSNKQVAIPLNQKLIPIRKQFFEEKLNIRLSQVDIYWARLTFTGRDNPPKELQNSKEVLYYVKNSHGGIGYIDSQYLTEEVKVIPIDESN